MGAGMTAHQLKRLGGNVPAEPIPEILTDRAGIAKVLKVSKSCIDRWVRLRVIPCTLIGGTCRRFHIPAVLAAVQRYAIEEVR